MPDLADYAGQVVLVVADAVRATYQPLCERYGVEGFALLGGGDGELVLIGRDGEPVGRYPAATTGDDPALTQAIERELFASE